MWFSSNTNTDKVFPTAKTQILPPLPRAFPNHNRFKQNRCRTVTRQIIQHILTLNIKTLCSCQKQELQNRSYGQQLVYYKKLNNHKVHPTVKTRFPPPPLSLLSYHYITDSNNIEVETLPEEELQYLMLSVWRSLSSYQKQESRNRS